MSHIIGQKGKKYGLQIPAGRLAQNNRAKQQQKKVLKPTLGIFAAEEDEEDNIETEIAKQQRHAHSVAKNEQLYKEAIHQDPTVFDYDAVYDTFRTESEASKKVEKTQRKSKYIADLKAKAVEREREQNMVYERRMIKEVKKEDHLYGDKEKFVTSSYRKKLEEEKKWVEEQRQKDEEERRNDVTKKGNLGDFYKNLLTKNVAFGTQKSEQKIPDSTEKEHHVQETNMKEYTREKEPPRAEPDIPSQAQIEEKNVKDSPVKEDHPTEEGEDRKMGGRFSSLDPFIESSTFSGHKNGYVFKTGHLGLGYYSEDQNFPPPPVSEKPAEAKKVDLQERRNTKAAVDAARLRYLERKRKASNMT